MTDALEKWIRDNSLRDAEDIDALLEAAEVARQLIFMKDCEGIGTMISYTVENGLFEGFSWIMSLLQDEFDKGGECVLHDFSCDLGRSIKDYDELLRRLEVDLNAQKNDVEFMYDVHGEVDSFFNNVTYRTGYSHIYLVSSENYDAKDNDFVQYRLLFSGS
ncbi:MAG: hypothetical protein IKE27_07580 [Oscillospiraceae bacterium]|nr:hypothetical protein [Oscillospiraceae bacterium]